MGRPPRLSLRRPPRRRRAGLALGALVGLAAYVALSAPRLTDGAGGAAATGAPNNAFRTGRIDTCVRPRHPAGIRAYASDGTLLPFTLATGHEPGTRPRCPSGDLRILGLEALTIDGQRAYVRRGGCRQPCRVRQPTVHVLARDLAGPVALLPAAARGGDGAAAAGCARRARAAPGLAGGDLARMFYKTPAEISETRRRTGIAGAGARWSNYGDPGRRYGAADYTYLLWNLPRRRSGAPLPGGGIVEAVIAEGQAVALCTLPSLTLPAFDAAGSANGEVVFGYARADLSGPIYGWLLLGYRYGSRPFRSVLMMS